MANLSKAVFAPEDGSGTAAPAPREAPGAPQKMTVTTQVAQDKSLTVEPATGASEAGKGSVSVEPTKEPKTAAQLAAEQEAAALGEGKEPAEPETTEEPKAPDEGEPPADLGDFTGTPEDIAKFDAHYLTGENQQLNREAIGKEFWARRNALPEVERKGSGHMSEGFYKWAEQTFNVDRDFITEYEEGLSAKAALQEGRGNQQEAQFIATVPGGLPALQAAIAWGGTDTGYTADQRKRFDAEYAAGGERRADAVDALMARWNRAGAPGKPAEATKPVGRRRSSPAVDATGGAAVGGGSGADTSKFKNEAEFSSALAAARKRERDAGGNNTEIRKARAEMDGIREKARRGYRE